MQKCVTKMNLKLQKEFPFLKKVAENIKFREINEVLLIITNFPSRVLLS